MNTPGDTFLDFKLSRKRFIQELNCTFRELVHIPSGAHVMHIENDDPENLFCLSFKTHPYDSNGAAHVLEHTVLCGSKKYPVKDPFFSMAKRSLHTFMNAMTGSDFTCYPAATLVEKDFYNLLDVYLDAVFNPLLKKTSFLQEGVRLEFANPSDKDSPLIYKGIVFNEMKGALSSSSARMVEVVNAALYPDIAYGFNSGGDPKIIPSLTYEKLVDFHKTFYHPSRCLFFFYGNLPLEKHLKYIQENTLNSVEKVDDVPLIPKQRRFQAPKYIETTHPIAQDESAIGKTLVSISWLTSEIQDVLTTLGLSALVSILTDNDSAPLKKACLKSGLCTQFSVLMDNEITEIPVMFFFRGCEPQNAKALEEVVIQALKDIVKETIPRNLIDNHIHQLEISRLEINADGNSPFGLNMFFRSAMLQQHGVDPLEGLRIYSLFQDLEEKLKQEPRFFENLIQTYFIDNPHRVTVLSTPDKNLIFKEEEEEKEQLEMIRESLSEEQKNKILRETLELKANSKPEGDNIDILPKIHSNEIPTLVEKFDLEIKDTGRIKTYTHSCFTNNILYADLAFDLPKVPFKDLPYYRLLTYLITELGVDGQSYAQTLEEINADTGGIGSFIKLNLQAENCYRFHPTFHLQGKALFSKKDKLFKLFGKFVRGSNFNDRQRVKELIFKLGTSLENSLNQNALNYAVNLTSSNLSSANKVTQEWFGTDFILFLRDITANFDVKWPELLSKLTSLEKAIFSFGTPNLIVTGSEAILKECESHGYWGLSDLKTEAKPLEEWDYSLEKMSAEGRLISSRVAFIAQAFKTISYNHPDAALLSVLSFMIDNIYLHNKLREEGGAYGGGAMNNAIAGNFYFYSLRDPHILSTLQAFEEALHMIARGEFEDSDVEDAKIELAQVFNLPTPPGKKASLGYRLLREGKTEAARQLFHDRGMGATKNELQEAVKKHLLPGFKTSAPVVFASQELFKKEKAPFKLHPI